MLLNQSTNETAEVDLTIQRIKIVSYQYVLPTILAMGILGNILNLITLKNPKLRSTPFKYIEAVAVFDLLGLLLALLACIRIAGQTPSWYFLVVYQAYFELPFLNGFLAGSLFTAVALSMERYFMICRPHDQRCCQPTVRFKVNTSISLALAILLHLPMAAENRVARNGDVYKRAQNTEIHAPGSKWNTTFTAYEILREVVRGLSVAVLSILNAVIIRALRKASKKRKRLISKSTLTDTINTDAAVELIRRKKQVCTINKSYEEKRITTMMIGMSLVYIIGNIPQACLMPYNEDHHQHSFTFQMFRAIANLAEINNHCLNFYIFCISSRDYMSAFWETCKSPSSLFKRNPEKAATSSKQQRSATEEDGMVTIGRDNDCAPLSSSLGAINLENSGSRLDKQLDPINCAKSYNLENACLIDEEEIFV